MGTQEKKKRKEKQETDANKSNMAMRENVCHEVPSAKVYEDSWRRMLDVFGQMHSDDMKTANMMCVQVINKDANYFQYTSIKKRDVV